MSKDDSVKEEVLEIMAEIFKAFYVLLLKNNTLVSKDELMRIIPDQLNSNNQALRKKATNCIGTFAVILNNKQLHTLCQTLLDKVRKSRSKEDTFTLV